PPSGTGRLALVGSGLDDPWTETILGDLSADADRGRAVHLAVGPADQARRQAYEGEVLVDPSALAITAADRGAHDSALDAVSRADLVVVSTEDPVRAVRRL